MKSPFFLCSYFLSCQLICIFEPYIKKSFFNRKIVNNIMFSGIVEEYATLVALVKDQENIHFTFKCSFVNELKIDQSISHNGVCLHHTFFILSECKGKK